MSGWVLAVREVYEAGGRMPICRMSADRTSINRARARGFLEPGFRGGPRMQHEAIITQAGRDLIECRLTIRFPSYGDSRGREKGTHGRLAATWLAALPKANEVRV